MSTPLVSRAGPSWRAVALVLAGMLAGVLVSQTALARVTAGSVTPAATAKWASCPDVAFYPGWGGDPYSQDSVKRMGASERMYCGLTLPHGTTIKAVKFHLFDGTNAHEVDLCEAYRVKLDPPNGTAQRLAAVPATGVGFNGGYVTKADTSIDFPVVDNRHYAYLVQCRLPNQSLDLAIIGASVAYTPG